MKKLLIGLTMLAAVSASPVYAKGCLAGAAVGGVGGHFVGNGHAVLGAAGGCVAGHYIAKHNDEKRQRESYHNQQNQQYDNTRRN